MSWHAIENCECHDMLWTNTNVMACYRGSVMSLHAILLMSWHTIEHY